MHLYKTHLITIVLVICGLHTYPVKADTHITKNTTFSLAKSPYIIDQPITIDNGAKLTIEKGVTLIFRKGQLFFKNASLTGSGFIMNVESEYNFDYLITSDHSSIDISNISILGNPQSILSAWNHSAIQLSHMDVDFLGDTSHITSIQIFGSSTLTLSDSIFSRFEKALDIFQESYATVTDCVFTYNKKSIDTFDSYIELHNNDFVDNEIAVDFFIDTNTQSYVHAEYNWWGNKSGPSAYTYSSEAPQSAINIITEGVTYTPWSLSPHKLAANSAVSNVLFLPGLMGSRLYQKGVFENQLWEPNRNKDVTKLYLDASGQSIQKNIYTRDVILKTNIVGGVDAIEQTPYKDFFTYMDTLVSKGVIQTWKSAPYDWRYSPDTIIEQGVQIGDGKQVFTDNIVAEVLLLAKTSKTKKVTIITHSNGGLVAKSLMIELQKKHLDSLIDKIIFVAMPEYGAPQAITSLMYGHEQSIAGGLILSASVAQKLGVNMPTAYTLLPSQKYFQTGKTVPFYENTVNDKSFFNVKLTEKSQINNNLLHEADQFHTKVDGWIAPSYIQVYQIVGTGLLTVSGVSKDADGQSVPLYTPTGDGVVQDMFDTSSRTYNRSGISFTVDLHNTTYKHMDIMNSVDTMKYITECLSKNMLDYTDISHQEYSQAYTRISLTPPFSTSTKQKLSTKKIQIHTDTTKDFFDYTDSTQFSVSHVTDSSSRYDLFNTSLQYISQKPVSSFVVEEKMGDVFNMSVYNKTDAQTIEYVYQDVQLYKDSLALLKQDTGTSLQIDLPLVNQKVEIPPTKEVVYDSTHQVISETYATTTPEDFSEKLTRIIDLMSTSNILSYIKTRYVSKLKNIQKNKDEKGFISLQQKIDRAIRSIDSYAYSPALKGRYTKLRQDYIYLSYIFK